MKVDSILLFMYIYLLVFPYCIFWECEFKRLVWNNIEVYIVPFRLNELSLNIWFLIILEVLLSVKIYSFFFFFGPFSLSGDGKVYVKS